MQVLRVEPTPNPNAIKFVLDAMLGSPSEYRNAEEAASNDLAKELFAMDGVETLFLSENFVTVTMNAGADWHQVHELARKTIEAHQGDGFTQASSAAPIPVIREGAHDEAGENGQMLDQIGAVITQRVMPALNADGGGLQVIGIDEHKVVTIQYQGACGSCPSAIQGTLAAIENLLKSEVDPDLRVVPAGMAADPTGW
jgi:NFU1 iron-sulfur cluster scaffold homolog, mitochondrial